MKVTLLVLGGRPPHGGRGLKFNLLDADRFAAWSSPSRGTWIEMSTGRSRSSGAKSSPSRGTWIEMRVERGKMETGKSSPSRGTWIEMLCLGRRPRSGRVVPLTGDVD